MLLIFVFSGGAGLPLAERVWDKAIHAGGYGALGLLCLRAFHGGIDRLRVPPTIGAVVIVLSYGAMMEWYQATLPGRVASLGDWVADGVGAGLACVVFEGIGRWRVRGGGIR